MSGLIVTEPSALNVFRKLINMPVKPKDMPWSVLVIQSVSDIRSELAKVAGAEFAKRAEVIAYEWITSTEYESAGNLYIVYPKDEPIDHYYDQVADFFTSLHVLVRYM